MIIIVFGLPGTGKSYFASRLAKSLDADYVNTDKLRKQLFSKPEYTEDEKKLIYKRMLDEMYHHAHSKKLLVMDGTFYQKHIREDFIQLAKDLNIELLWIEVLANEELVKERLKEERVDSDADYDIYKLIKEQYEPFIDSPKILRISSSNGNINEMLKTANEYLSS